MCALMSAAPCNSNFNLALGYKQHSVEGLTRKTQHSSLIMKSWIPFYFHRMFYDVSFHPTNRQEWKYTLLNVVTSKKNHKSVNVYIHAYIIMICATVGNICLSLQNSISQHTFVCQVMIDGRDILCSSPKTIYFTSTSKENKKPYDNLCGNTSNTVACIDWSSMLAYSATRPWRSRFTILSCLLKYLSRQDCLNIFKLFLFIYFNVSAREAWSDLLMTQVTFQSYRLHHNLDFNF